MPEAYETSREIPIAIVAIEQIVFVGKICHVQRWPPGMQVVADRDAHRGLLGTVFTDRRSRFQADVLEFSIALILVQKFRRRIVGDVNVRPPGIVEVRPNHAQAVVAVRIVHSRALRNVRKGSVAIVVKQRVAGAL